MRYPILFLLLIIFSANFINAEQENLGFIKQNDCVRVYQTCSSCTVGIISSILYPNKTTANSSITLVTDDNFEYYTYFCHTTDLGQYIINGYIDVDGSNTPFAYDFIVTGNGKENPSGIVIVLFAILFLIIMMFLVAQLVLSIGHFMNLDFDVMDLSKSWGIYFGLLGLYWLQSFYLGNNTLEHWLYIFILIGAWTHMLIPLIAFVISITIGSLKKQKFDVGLKRFRRTKLQGVHL